MPQREKMVNKANACLEGTMLANLKIRGRISACVWGTVSGSLNNLNLWLRL